MAKFTDEAIRVIKLTKKPRKDEFIMIAKITGLGMLVIGVMGMIISIIGNITGISG